MEKEITLLEKGEITESNIIDFLKKNKNDEPHITKFETPPIITTTKNIKEDEIYWSNEFGTEVKIDKILDNEQVEVVNMRDNVHIRGSIFSLRLFEGQLTLNNETKINIGQILWDDFNKEWVKVLEIIKGEEGVDFAKVEIVEIKSKVAITRTKVSDLFLSNEPKVISDAIDEMAALMK